MNRCLIFVLFLGLLTLPACNQGDVKKNEKETMESAKASHAQAAAETETEKMDKPMSELTPPTKDEVGDPTELAVISTDLGDIIVKFYPDVAPLHVANFKKLARAGFYDGTTFHRVIPGFVIQGGDPNSKDDNPYNDGTGGPPWNLKAEFNDIKHDKGILSMARSQDPNSAGSQFFICLARERTSNLDHQYTVFGEVVKGLDVVDKIGAQRRDPRKDAQKTAVGMKSVRVAKPSEVGL